MYYVDSSGSMWTGTGGVNNGSANNDYSVVLDCILVVEDEFNFDWYVRRVALGCQR